MHRRTMGPCGHVGALSGKQVLHPALVSAVTFVGKAQSLAGYLHSGMNNFVCTQH